MDCQTDVRTYIRMYGTEFIGLSGLLLGGPKKKGTFSCGHFGINIKGN